MLHAQNQSAIGIEYHGVSSILVVTQSLIRTKNTRRVRILNNEKTNYLKSTLVHISQKFRGAGRDLFLFLVNILSHECFNQHASLEEQKENNKSEIYTKI